MAATGLTSDSLEPQEVTLDSTGAMSDSLEPLEPQATTTGGATNDRYWAGRGVHTPLLLRVKSRTANNCASLNGRHTAVHVS